jgi:hypothetical protein
MFYISETSEYITKGLSRIQSHMRRKPGYSAAAANTISGLMGTTTENNLHITANRLHISFGKKQHT